MARVTASAPDRAPRAARHPARRQVELAGGVLLIVATPAVALLPGPAGTVTFAGGMILILRNSHWARLRWARLKRRWPKTGGFIDRAMRRGSALRRRDRDRDRDSNRRAAEN